MYVKLVTKMKIKTIIFNTEINSYARLHYNMYCPMYCAQCGGCEENGCKLYNLLENAIVGLKVK